MTRTYEIVQQGQHYRILSNGKPLRWYYLHRSFAEGVVEHLKEKAERRQRHAEWRQERGIPSSRDSKRAAAYAAERRAGLRDGPVLQLTPDDIRRKCIRWAAMAAERGLLEGIPGVKSVLPQVRITRRKKGNGAHAWLNHIVFAPRAVTLGTIAHEYAHVMTWEARPAHDWTWAAVYVALVRVAFGDDLGPIYGDRLEREFRNIGLGRNAA